MKLAWMNDNGTPDAIPTILSLSPATSQCVTLDVAAVTSCTK